MWPGKSRRKDLPSSLIVDSSLSIEGVAGRILALSLVVLAVDVRWSSGVAGRRYCRPSCRCHRSKKKTARRKIEEERRRRAVFDRSTSEFPFYMSRVFY
ncbi:hypothetical protein DM860_016577 [Cuscuta australis]|uniref:Uncharacterized protein n=1 Tax=Cuscuta australis TaxID=267555 RepID=A0A328DSG8_9ASTE|nr:hypothetical protein DM860_016577 [Cuscuta australis]